MRFTAPSHEVELQREADARWSARVTRDAVARTYLAAAEQAKVLDECWRRTREGAPGTPTSSSKSPSPDTIEVEGSKGTFASSVGREEEGAAGRVIAVRWEGGARALLAECARPLRQPERLLRDPGLIDASVEAWDEVVLPGGHHLERRGPARWGPRGETGELPAAPGVWRYVQGLEARERVEGATPPAEALSLTVRGAWGEDTLALWEEGGEWRARSGHTGAVVRVDGPVEGAVADVRRLAQQVKRGALAQPQLSDPDHAVGGR